MTLLIPTPESPTTTSSPSTTSVTIPERFVGPPGMANGGWIAGTVAAHVAAASVEVTLRAPTPLDQPLTLATDGTEARLLDGERLLVEARPAPISPLAPSPVPFADAAIAETRFPAHDHPFPGCFVCGHERAPGDGLRIFPGAVPGLPDTVASWWQPPVDLAGPDGELVTEAVWAALDCPTGWAHAEPGGVAVLGRLTAIVHRPVEAGRTYVVVAQRAGSERRKRFARAGIYDDEQRLVAASFGVWVSLR